MNSIVNTIKQNLINEKLYGDEIESSVQNVTAREALLKEIEALYSRFCKNKNQGKLFQSFLLFDAKIDDSSEFCRSSCYHPCNDTHSRPLSIIQ